MHLRQHNWEMAAFYVNSPHFLPLPLPFLFYISSVGSLAYTASRLLFVDTTNRIAFRFPLSPSLSSKELSISLSPTLLSLFFCYFSCFLFCFASRCAETTHFIYSFRRRSTRRSILFLFFSLQTVYLTLRFSQFFDRRLVRDDRVYRVARQRASNRSFWKASFLSRLFALPAVHSVLLAALACFVCD